MSLIDSQASLLLKNVDIVFSPAEMPCSEELIFHEDGCYLCDEIKRYLEASRNFPVDGALIRFIHQELYHLSPKAYRWIIPHYLKYCLDVEEDMAQEEVYFLVYNLSPSLEFQEDTHCRLSNLNKAEIDFLIAFLEWCGQKENWVEIRENVKKAIVFLREVGASL